MIRLLRPFLSRYRPQLALVVALLLVQAIANLYLPTLNADIINEGVVKGDTDYIVRVGGVMLGVTFLLGLTAIVSTYFAARTSMAVGRDLRSHVFRKVQTFAQVEVNRFGAASLITRNTNDIQQVQMVVLMALVAMISAPILAVGGVIMALRQDVPLSGLLLVIVPAMALVVTAFLRRALPLFVSMQQRIDRINLVTREALAGIRIIRAFVRTDYERGRFDDANRDLTETALAVNQLFALMMPMVMAKNSTTTSMTPRLGSPRFMFRRRI